MTVKKVFSEVFDLLNSNPESLVSELMPKLIELMSSKSDVGSTNYKVDGQVVAVYCYYHKKWELTTEHVYGQKAGTTTGLNSMCKLGVSEWTKQQRQAKKAGELLLDGLASGEVTIDQLTYKKQEIESNRNLVVFADEYPVAFDTLEELKLHLDGYKEVKVKKSKKV